MNEMGTGVVEPILVSNARHLYCFQFGILSFGSSTKWRRRHFGQRRKSDLAGDTRDWEALTKSEQTFICHVLAFFACVRWYCEREYRPEFLQ